MPARPYVPRHAARTPAAAAVAARVQDEPIEDDPIKAPGLAAALRRNPEKVRKSALGLLATGVLLFGAAESAAAAFGEGNQLRVATRAPAGSHGVTDPTVHRAVAPLAAPAGAKALSAAPVKARTKAPATKAVISGLAANGIPNVALNAYRVAAARVNHADPGCGIDWALLAGIGRVESDHGRFAGARLNADGTSTPRIMGPALDGARWDYIPAPADGAALYGDGVYAHALGPMQFIPSTWAAYGADANGDGTADVFNVNDAALGAARYLCAAGGNLRAPAGQTAAVLAYNHSDEYLAQVLALANAYRHGIPVTGIPVGNVNGALPPLNSAGYAPPVNPADPPAAAGPTGPHATARPPPRPVRAPARPTSAATGGSRGAPGGGTGTPGPTSGPTQPTGTSTPGGGVLPTSLPSSAAPTPTPAPTASPTPTPTKTCTPLQHILLQC